MVKTCPLDDLIFKKHPGNRGLKSVWQDNYSQKRPRASAAWVSSGSKATTGAGIPQLSHAFQADLSKPAGASGTLATISTQKSSMVEPTC